MGSTPWSCSCAGRKTANPGEAAIFFWLSRFFLVIFWNKGLQVELFAWNGDLAEHAGRTGPGHRFLAWVFLQDWWSQGFSIFSPFLVRCPFDFGGRDSSAGLGAGSWVRVESRSIVLLPSPPSILLSTRDLWRFETVPSNTGGRCMFGFSGRQRPWDFTPSLKCQSSHCFQSGNTETKSDIF